jgi:hypothetical protein
MVSRDFVPMRDRIAGPRATGKPLQIAVDSVTGTTEAARHPRHRHQPAPSATMIRPATAAGIIIFEPKT